MRFEDTIEQLKSEDDVENMEFEDDRKKVKIERNRNDISLQPVPSYLNIIISPSSFSNYSKAPGRKKQVGIYYTIIHPNI